jgi:arginyl-tRNA synthetase
MNGAAGAERGLFDFAGLAGALERVVDEMSASGDLPALDRQKVELSLPPRPEFGDVSSNVALALAGKSGRRPRDLADEIGRRLLAGEGASAADRYEVAGPGFLNLFLSSIWYRGALQRMLDAGPAYGSGVLAESERQRVNVEFVSVNPTGPLHVGHARYAAYGDALCRIFAFAGHHVTREFYVNDHGTQMLRFGQSLAARYGQALGIAVDLPAEGYQGEYLADFARALVAEVGERYRSEVTTAAPRAEAIPEAVVSEIGWWGRDKVLALFRATLERMRVPFDVWTSERTLYEGGHEEHRGFRGEVGRALVQMDREGFLYDHEGAVWLRTTQYGDDKDRVLIRQSGAPTYFLSDIAYHRDKLDRGFEHLIDIWGADHHGYVPRMKAAFTALPPHDPDALELVIGQLVNLTESGEARRMSKRRGDIVTVDDLLDAIGVDAARFFLVGRSHDSTLELDLDLAVEQSSKNPVYYVQYAHARICSILKNLRGRDAGASAPASRARLPELDLGSYERALVRALARFPLVLREAAVRRAPHRLHAYLGELAAEFHVFYRHCRVLVDDEDVTAYRIGLCRATQSTLASGLSLLGVGAPDSM